MRESKSAQLQAEVKGVEINHAENKECTKMMQRLKSVTLSNHSQSRDLMWFKDGALIAEMTEAAQAALVWQQSSFYIKIIN